MNDRTLIEPGIINWILGIRTWLNFVKHQWLEVEDDITGVWSRTDLPGDVVLNNCPLNHLLLSVCESTYVRPYQQSVSTDDGVLTLLSAINCRRLCLSPEFTSITCLSKHTWPAAGIWDLVGDPIQRDPDDPSMDAHDTFCNSEIGICNWGSRSRVQSNEWMEVEGDSDSGTSTIP